MAISVEGGRVLGCLVEKEFTTPQQYPLTLSALVSACNQATNRHPVMALDETTVQRALDELKSLGLVRFVLPPHGKSVTRFRQVLDESYGLDRQRVVILAVLLLRGPQTAGELRARSERMAEFDSIDAVLHELGALAGHPDAVLRQLPRRPGQKEDRWQQLLASESNAPGSEGGMDEQGTDEWHEEPSHPNLRQSEGFHPSGVGDPNGLASRIESLEARVTQLDQVVTVLHDALTQLRRSLGDEDP